MTSSPTIVQYIVRYNYFKKIHHPLGTSGSDSSSSGCGGDGDGTGAGSDSGGEWMTMEKDGGGGDNVNEDVVDGSRILRATKNNEEYERGGC